MDLLPKLKEELEGKSRELRERGIVAIILFGSLIKGNVRPESDVDIAVLKEGSDADRIYQELQRALRRDVDLPILNEAPPRMRFSALKGEVVYVSDERELLSFIMRVYDEWADLEHLRRIVWSYTERWLTQ